MKSHVKILAPIVAAVLLSVGGRQLLNGQITQRIQAHIDHSFMVGKKTLPPGAYTFRMQHDTEALLIITNEDSKKSIEVVVGQSMDNHVPKHAELVFRKYGDTEFLSKVFQSGEKIGVELTESKSEEKRLAQNGSVVEHIEQGQ